MSEALSAPNDGVNMGLPRQPGGSEGSMTKNLGQKDCCFPFRVPARDQVLTSMQKISKG